MTQGYRAALDLLFASLGAIAKTATEPGVRREAEAAIGRAEAALGTVARRQEVFLPGPWPGLNTLIETKARRRGRGSSAYTLIKRRREADMMVLLRAGGLERFTRPVRLSLTVVEEDRRRDPDNVVAGARKLLLDALQGGAARRKGEGLEPVIYLERDSWKYLRAPFLDDWRVAGPGEPAGIYAVFEEMAE